MISNFNFIKQKGKLFLFLLLLSKIALTQSGLNDLNFVATSSFVPTIKDVLKFADLPEIKDSVKRISNIKYGINSSPIFPNYQIQQINAPKLENEPLQKLYYSLLKIGYAPIYSSPLAEYSIANNRSRESAYGAYFKHFSSNTQYDGTGLFSDNVINLFGKKFYKKHTLSANFIYDRRVVNYYGGEKNDNSKKNNQRYQFIEPKIQLQSHYSDSTHINHFIELSFYNLNNLHNEVENNFKVNTLANLFINKERLFINFLSDFYNYQKTDTNDLILSLYPFFEAAGNKWKADIGLKATFDYFKMNSKFYFYPQINLKYNVYENIIVSYIGLTGGLMKNSFRNLSLENLFVDTTLNYTNTDNKFNLIIGLKGNLSSSSSYDAKVSYEKYNNMHFFSIDTNSLTKVYNHFDVLYDNVNLLKINGQFTQNYTNKFTLFAKANYYIYTGLEKIKRAYHKPDYDITLSGTYNLKSKFIVKADIFLIGERWALSKNINGFAPAQLKPFIDANLEAEYRYTKMLSFFVRFNNIANQPYYKWQYFQSQRFNFMMGLTFVPF